MVPYMLWSLDALARQRQHNFSKFNVAVHDRVRSKNARRDSSYDRTDTATAATTAPAGPPHCHGVDVRPTIYECHRSREQPKLPDALQGRRRFRSEIHNAVRNHEMGWINF